MESRNAQPGAVPSSQLSVPADERVLEGDASQLTLLETTQQMLDVGGAEQIDVRGQLFLLNQNF